MDAAELSEYSQHIKYLQMLPPFARAVGNSAPTSEHKGYLEVISQLSAFEELLMNVNASHFETIHKWREIFNPWFLTVALTPVALNFRVTPKGFDMKKRKARLTRIRAALKVLKDERVTIQQHLRSANLPEEIESTDQTIDRIISAFRYEESFWNPTRRNSIALAAIAEAWQRLGRSRAELIRDLVILLNDREVLPDDITEFERIDKRVKVAFKEWSRLTAKYLRQSPTEEFVVL